jgi:hypothetical protein
VTCKMATPVRDRYTCKLNSRQFPEFLTGILGWTRDQLIAASANRLLPGGRLEVEDEYGQTMNVIPLDGVKLDDIHFVIPLDMIMRLFYTDLEKKLNPNIGTQLRKLVREDCLEYFWLSLLVKNPRTLVSGIYKQYPPILAALHKESAIKKRERRKRERVDIIPVPNWDKIVGPKQCIPADRIAPNLLQPMKVGPDRIYYESLDSLHISCRLSYQYSILGLKLLFICHHNTLSCIEPLSFSF